VQYHHQHINSHNCCRHRDHFRSIMKSSHLYRAWKLDASSRSIICSAGTTDEIISFYITSETLWKNEELKIRWSALLYKQCRSCWREAACIQKRIRKSMRRSHLKPWCKLSTVRAKTGSRSSRAQRLELEKKREERGEWWAMTILFLHFISGVRDG
jgi:hypothetical protein